MGRVTSPPPPPPPPFAERRPCDLVQKTIIEHPQGGLTHSTTCRARHPSRFTWHVLQDATPTHGYAQGAHTRNSAQSGSCEPVGLPSCPQRALALTTGRRHSRLMMPMGSAVLGRKRKGSTASRAFQRAPGRSRGRRRYAGRYVPTAAGHTRRSRQRRVLITMRSVLPPAAW